MSFTLESEINLQNLEIKKFKFELISKDSKLVKIGLVQNAVNFSLDDNEWSQEKVFNEIEEIVMSAANAKVNILALPELFGMPYPFYTPDEIKWRNFAEPENGKTFKFFSKLSKIHNMVIIASILESDDNKIFNTCLVISNYGEIIGKYRKHHIPPIELEHLTPGDFDCPVFDTDFGKIGILICYERHFPLKWLTMALKGAQIIFNPSSEDEKSLSERMWKIEGLNAAVSNGIFTASINRVGIEKFNEKSIKYFGSSYIASPYGFITDALSSNQSGLLIAEIDVNATKNVKSDFSFHKNVFLKNYIQALTKTLTD